MGSQYRNNNFKKIITRAGILGERKTTIVRILGAKPVKIGAIIRRILLYLSKLGKTFSKKDNKKEDIFC